MKQELETLKMSLLTNIESAQLIKHLLGDLATIQTSLSDAPLLNYVRGLTTSLINLEPALVPVTKDDATTKVKAADKSRKEATKALGMAINQGSVSDDAAEQDAHHSLSIIFDAHKNNKSHNYEGETTLVDTLLNNLTAANLADKVAILGLQRYIDRLRNSNEAFKAIATDRSTAKAQKEVFDTKALRAELYATYDDFVHYVLAMSKAHNTTEFTSVLAMINATRKQYADMLAKRNGKNAAAANAEKTVDLTVVK